MRIIFCFLIFITFTEIKGGADYEVEQIKSPYVDSKAVGPMMSMSDSNRQIPGRYYPQGTYQHGCISCQYGSAGSSGRSFSSGYQSPGTYRSYSSPSQMSSSKHEFKNEQEFVNGQQVYDFHLEKEYKDGNLVKNDIREKTADDFGVKNYPHGAPAYGSKTYGSSVVGAPKTVGSSYSSRSSHSNYNILPQPSRDVTFEGAPYSTPSKIGAGHHQGYGTNTGLHREEDNFESEIERLRKEMEMRAHTLHEGSTGHSPTHHGGSHRTEVRTEMKYVNGKPVYIKNEERKYKDGKLVHDATEEKGPEDLGTTGVITGHNGLSTPSRIYSRHQEEQISSQGQYPSSRYHEQPYASNPYYSSPDLNSEAPNNFQPSSHSSTSENVYSSYKPTRIIYPTGSQQIVNHLPGKVYSTEIREEHEQTRTASGYNPVGSASQTVHSSYEPSGASYTSGTKPVVNNIPGRVYSTEIREEHEQTHTASGYKPASSISQPVRSSYEPSGSIYSSGSKPVVNHVPGRVYSTEIREEHEQTRTASGYKPVGSVNQPVHSSYEPSSTSYSSGTKPIVNIVPGRVYSTETREEHEQMRTATGYQPSVPVGQTVHGSFKNTESSFPYDNKPIVNYESGKVYSTEIRQEHEQTRTASGYKPTSYGRDSEYRYDQSYQPSSYGSPVVVGPTTLRPNYHTTTTTLAPEISTKAKIYDYSSSQTQEFDSTSRHYKPSNTNYDSDIALARPDRYTPRSHTSGSSQHYSSESNKRRYESYGQQPSTTSTPSPTTRSYSRPTVDRLSQNKDTAREASHTSYFNQRPSSGYYPRKFVPEVSTDDQRPKTETDTQYSRSSTKSHFQTAEELAQTSESFQPKSYSSSVTTRDDKTRPSSAGSYPSQYNHKVNQERYYKRISTDDDENEYDDDGNDGDDDENVPNDKQRSEAGQSSENVGFPGVISGPLVAKYPNRDEHERYDISPLVDGAESEAETNEVPEANSHMSRPRPTYDESKYKPIAAPLEPTRTRYYEHSKTSNDHEVHQTRPVLIPRPRYDQEGSILVTNSSSTHSDHRTTTVIPSRWVETRTKWKYFNGRLVSETQYHKYYENGILIHDNATEKTRDQLAEEGVDVQNLDLSASQLAEYGPVMKSTTHSQSHEVTQIQRFKNGQQTYELNHDRRFQDGHLVNENRDEKNEDDFARIGQADNLRNTNRQQQFLTGGYESAVAMTDLHHTKDIPSIPSGFVRKHEVRQEEEFVNGQKVYNLFHEKEYQDGNLIRENKTELGPDDLGAQSVLNRDALKDLLDGRTHSHRGQESLHQQQKTTEKILTSQCLTCHNQMSTSGGSSSRSYITGGHSSSVLGSLGIPVEQTHPAATTFKHDVNVEEHYENGQMVKGREDTKKWRDGRLIDAKTEHYYDGSSRTNLDLSGSPVFGGDSTLAFSGAEEASIHKDEEECSYNYCLNGATCKKRGTTQVCICKLGFKGSRCEEAYCPASFCGYGGSCSASTGVQVCACLTGYTGYRCTARIHSIRIGT